MVSPERAADAPLVSIGVPVYNGGEYLEASLRSLLDQSYRTIELVISDNASTDGSGAICERMAAQDPRIVYVRQSENIGGVGNHNKVRELSRGRYFMWGSSDDLWQPSYVERCVQVLESRPDVVLAYAVNARIDEQGQRINEVPPGPPLDSDSVLDRFVALTDIWRVIEPFYGVIRKSALDRTAMMIRHPGFDRILLAELGLLGKFVQLPEPLYLRRVHAQQSINAYPSLRSRYRWINPDAKGRMVWPHVSYGLHFAKAAWRSAPALRGRAACLKHMVRWCHWHRQQLWEDLIGVE